MTGPPSSFVFLGICRNALVSWEGMGWDFLGVGTQVPVPFFPMSTKGLYYLVGMSNYFLNLPQEVEFFLQARNSPALWGRTSLSMAKPEGTCGQVEVSRRPGVPVSDKSFGVWFGSRNGEEARAVTSGYTIVPIACPDLLVPEPASFDLQAKCGGQEDTIGSFEVVFACPAPLSLAERTAIMSDPHATQSVSLVLGCSECGAEISVGASLGQVRIDTRWPEGTIALDDAPDEWECGCEGRRWPLTYLKQGVHELFRRKGRRDEALPLGYTPLYEQGAIERILQEYEELISSDPAEGAVQTFLRDHAIFWHFLAPTRVVLKPPILTKYVADFGILAADRTLYLVEIERPGTRLAKSSGGMHSQLQAAFDQLREWHVVVEEHRSSVLECLEIDPGGVDNVRYIAVAGLARSTQPEELRKIRTSLSDTQRFVTFDELAAFLRATQYALGRL
jgi:hypothetical protein